MVNFLKNNPYILLDYFAILPNYQSRGYGRKAIKLLKEISDKIEKLNINIEIINISFLWFLGFIVAVVVIYILYKCIDEFISF